MFYSNSGILLIEDNVIYWEKSFKYTTANTTTAKIFSFLLIKVDPFLACGCPKSTSEYSYTYEISWQA